MNESVYKKYSKFYEGTHTVLYDCSAEVPHLAIGIWRGFFQLKNQTFIDEMWLSIDFIKEKKIIAMISDHSGLQVVSKDVLAWLHDNWYPNAAKHGLRIEAALDAESPLAQLSLKNMLDEAKTGTISTPVFRDFQAAYAFCVKFLNEYTKL
ncbi:hypothetical protein U27_00179 [Candidatus Vecturithrix granuli]|uniref:Uncharacterized protein n=1 Tax=Vecturithrix granuli TaxID=1499967 RepID=A0A081C6T3_VECG1|nr:hypothetical protein U27_00179 [Candidatus Vecturithrix granuli]